MFAFVIKPLYMVSFEYKRKNLMSDPKKLTIRPKILPFFFLGFINAAYMGRVRDVEPLSMVLFIIIFNRVFMR